METPTMRVTPANGGCGLWTGHHLPRQGFQWCDWVAFSWVVDLGCPMEMPKQARLMLGQSVTLWELRHCWGQHSSKSVKLAGQDGPELALSPLDSCFFGMGRKSACYRKRKQDNNPDRKLWTHNLPCKVCWGNGGTALFGVTNQYINT